MPQTFSRADVARIAALARLALTDEELNTFPAQLAGVLAYVEQVAEADTTGVPPTSSVLSPGQPLREDDPRPSLPVEDALANAPEADHRAGLFRVPRVIG